MKLSNILLSGVLAGLFLGCATGNCRTQKEQNCSSSAKEQDANHSTSGSESCAISGMESKDSATASAAPTVSSSPVNKAASPMTPSLKESLKTTSQFMKKKTLGPEKMTAQKYVKMYRPDGSLQCEKGSGMSLDEAKKEWANLDLEVLEAQVRPDGLMHIQQCGKPTGNVFVIRIALEHQEKALNLGWKVWTQD